MKAIIRHGCTGSGVTIDDRPLSEFTELELDIIVTDLFDRLKTRYLRGELTLSELIEMFPAEDYVLEGTCEQCRDLITKATYDI